MYDTGRFHGFRRYFFLVVFFAFFAGAFFFAGMLAHPLSPIISRPLHSLPRVLN
jgi:hypothetical protein